MKTAPNGRALIRECDRSHRVQALATCGPIQVLRQDPPSRGRRGSSGSGSSEAGRCPLGGATTSGLDAHGPRGRRWPGQRAMTEPSREAGGDTGSVGREPIAGGAGVSTGQLVIRWASGRGIPRPRPWAGRGGLVSTAPSYGWTMASVPPPLPLQAKRESLARKLAQVTHEYQVSADSSRARSCEVLRRTVAPRRKPNVV
jgi:hypothetical protein